MTEKIRRVVTTHDDSGAAVVLSDALIALPAIPGIEARGAVAWTTGAVPADNTNDLEGDTRAAGATLQGGSVFRVTDFGPGFVSPMHRTLSIDYCAVISGELELVLDGGDVISLKAGDVLVQRGTSHAWRNPSPDTTCRIVISMIEALPVSVNGKALEQNA